MERADLPCLNDIRRESIESLCRKELRRRNDVPGPARNESRRLLRAEAEAAMDVAARTAWLGPRMDGEADRCESRRLDAHPDRVDDPPMVDEPPTEERKEVTPDRKEERPLIDGRYEERRLEAQPAGRRESDPPSEETSLPPCRP